MSFPKQSALLIFLLALQFPLSASEISLPHLITYVDSSSDSVEITLSEEELKNFSSTQEALESTGLSFKESNQELTFHGFWNSSIKVYVNGILMNDPNTGKFDFSALDINSVRSIKINPVSTDGAVSVYIETLYADYTKTTFSLGGFSKSYFSFHNISPNDSWRCHGAINLPVIFKDGSSLILQENLSAGYDANHYGFLSNESSYEPSFSDSYKSWKWRYGGYEQKLVNNSFSSVYSSSKIPGATFGITNFISWNKQNCGITSGKYYSSEKEEDINATLAFPVFLPSKDFRIKLIPSYKISNLDYKKDSRYSQVHDLYRIHSFSLSEDCTIKNYYSVNSKMNYDFSKSNRLLSFFLNPGFSANVSGFDLTLNIPFNLFYTEGSGMKAAGPRFDFLYFAEIRKAFNIKENENISLFINASRNVTNPVFQQLYYDGGGGSGNPDLKTESSFSFYTGGSWNGKTELSIKPFLIFYKDKIGWVAGNGGNWRPENNGSSTNYGFDFSFDSASFCDFIRFKSNYTLCHAVLTTNESVYGKQIMYTPVHALNSVLEFNPLELLKVSFIYNFTSKKYTSNANTDFVPAQHYVDAKIDFKIKRAGLYLLWKNLLDFKYTEVSNYPGPGASVTLGGIYSY
ncbi:MAG: hypothetical protein MJ185_06125 [Treponema sp.]|nr:hypothetical protein [Treponema sp.]